MAAVPHRREDLRAVARERMGIDEALVQAAGLSGFMTQLRLSCAPSSWTMTGLPPFFTKASFMRFGCVVPAGSSVNSGKTFWCTPRRKASWPKSV